MGKKNLVSINDFSRDEILKIMELAAGFEADPHQQVLAGKVIASLFFEPSTRTRLSFESAINHLGGRVIGFSDTSNTSVSKGETFHDTITVISNYCDMIVMRHYIEGGPATQVKFPKCRSLMQATARTSTRARRCSTSSQSKRRRDGSTISTS